MPAWQRVEHDCYGPIAACADVDALAEGSWAARSISPKSHEVTPRQFKTSRRRGSVQSTIVTAQRPHVLILTLELCSLGFHFYVSFVWRFAFHFEGAYFRQLRGSLFGGFKSGRRELLTRAKRPFPVGPWRFHPGFKLTARRLPLPSNGQGTQISADHAH